MVTIESTRDVELRSRSSVRPVAIVAAAASLGAAAIHLWVVPAHAGHAGYAESWWVYSLFFVVVGVAQLAAAVRLLVRPAIGVLWAALLGNLVVIGIWVLSRTVVLPIRPTPPDGTAGRGDPFLGGYGAHAANAVQKVGFADLAATTFELIVVVSVLSLLPPTPARKRIVNLLFLGTLLLLAWRIVGPIV